GDLAAGGVREWLLADGLGGYAMGTVCGLRTRRYHGLLVVSGETPSIRHVGLAALDPVVTLPSGSAIRLGTHEWASGAVAPDGYRFLQDFTLVDGLPSWRWRIGDVVVERELAMIHGQPSVAVVHRLLAGSATLTLEALCTWRDAHGERHAGGGELPMAAASGGVVIAGAFRLARPGGRGRGGGDQRGPERAGAAARTRARAGRGAAAPGSLVYAGSSTEARGPGRGLPGWARAGNLAGSPPRPVTGVAAARQRARWVVAAATPADGTGAALALA